MAYLVPAVLGGLALAVVALVSISSARRARKRAHAPALEPQARILIHSINDDRCTGCDACVAVCPTNVLDLVDNKSRVLRFQDCIQCEACMWACPTDALVMHPEGTEPPPFRQPNLDEYYQTAVPGQYLIGEVAGKPLVRNGANLGRAVVEHMLVDGLVRSPQLADGSDPNINFVDVAIIGSGPAGLSAALTCVHHHLSYVVLEKETIIASTVARYPKGKLIMAEPYDSPNLSFLPVFDSSKEEIVPIWKDLIARVGLDVRLGEACETVAKRKDGLFDVKSTRACYRAQRVVLATGLRGRPRTLGVRGEELPKVMYLLEDPDDWRGKSVCVVGGGDSALEAAVALADAGAKVVLSYRGRAFNRAQPRNRQIAESYEAQRRIKIKYQSDVAEVGETTVTLKISDGAYKRYPNEAVFVLIGADPPIKWLNMLGITYIERPHMAVARAPHELILRLAPERAHVCPEDAPRAAALALGKDPAEVLAERPVEVVSKPKRWLRSAGRVFSGAGKLDKPMPLSEFARQSRRHSGRGRRDQLPPGERTRILRMLRDEGGRIADEESKVYVLADEQPRARVLPAQDATVLPRPAHAAPPPRTIEFSVADQLAGLPPLPAVNAPKQAVIVGLARAAAEKRRKRQTGRAQIEPPPVAAPRSSRAFIDAPTQHISDDDARKVARESKPPPPVPSPSLQFPVYVDEEPTHLAGFDAAEFMEKMDDEATRQIQIGSAAERSLSDSRIVGGSVHLDEPPAHLRTVDSVISSDRLPRLPPPSGRRLPPPGRRLPPPPFHPVDPASADEPTHSIELDKNRSPTLSDIDFDLD